MIVSFRTACGSRYHLDHTNNEFVQETPVLRRGPLFNKPQVVKGKRVQIWTGDATAPIRVIQTAPVVEREVTLEEQSIPASVSTEHHTFHTSQPLLGDGGATTSSP